MDDTSESKTVSTETPSVTEESGSQEVASKIEYPEYLVISPAPHIRSSDTTRSVMLDVIIGLLPAYVWGVCWFGFRALWLGIISVASCVLFEFLTEKLLKRPSTVGDLSAVVTGLILAMNLSSSVPIWLPIVGAFFAIVVVKQLFGGIGKNVVNPALAARVFLFISWGGSMASFVRSGIKMNGISTADIVASATLSETMASATADMVASATPLASLKGGILPDVTLMDMLLGKTGGSIGEVASLLLIFGGIWLLIRGVIQWYTPVAFIGTVAILTLIFPQTDSGNLQFMLCELFSGGLLLGSIFMATDYATAPVTKYGRLIYGVGCGLITVFIRYFGGYNEGVSFAILIMNLLVWYLDRFTMPVRFGGKGGKDNAKK